MPLRLPALPSRPRRHVLPGPLLALGLLLCALATSAGATTRDFYFEWISGDRGLAQNTVHGLHQDRDGFIWIATQGGLHRYDGQAFRVFQNDPTDPASLPDSLVTALAEDPHGDLWVGTLGAYVVNLSRATGDISHLAASVTDGIADGGLQVRALLSEPDGTLWVATAGGVDRIDPLGGRRTRVLDLPDARRANALARDFDGAVWLGTDAGLFRVPSGTREAAPTAHTAPVHSLLLDRRGRLWAGSRGLFEIDTSTGRGGPHWPRAGADFGSDTPVDALAEDASGRIWAAIRGQGLRRYDPDRGQVAVVREIPGVPATLMEDSISSLMLDRSGMLWVGGLIRGIAITDPEGARFRYVTSTAAGANWANDNSVRSMHEDAEGRLWIGLDGSGLRRYDPRADAFEDFSAGLRGLPRVEEGSGLRVMGILPAPDGLWLTGNFGLAHLDPATRRLEPAEVAPGRTDALPTRHLRRGFVMRDGSLLLTTTDAGVVRFHPAERRFEHIPARPGSPRGLSHPLTDVALEDRHGRIWVGSIQGLNLIDPATGQIQQFQHDPHDPYSLSGSRVRALLETRDGSLWVGTHSGLNRVREDQGRIGFERIASVEHLDGRQLTVFGLLESADGMLWISSNDGILRYDPVARSFRSYALRDGLQDLEFNGGAQVELADGRLAFGGIRGFNLFDPTRMRDSEFEPDVMLLGLRIGAEGQGGMGLRMPADIRIHQQARTLRLHFGALDFAAPGRLRYRYRLDGFDDGWIEAGVRTEATYTNLRPGAYRFRVQGTNRDGVWSSRELDLPLTVEPPWWNSPTSRLGYLATSILLAWLAWHLVRRRRQQERALMAEISEREERLKLALWGSGDEFWDWNIPDNRLYRMGADHLLGMENAEQELGTDAWRSDSVHPEDLPRVQKTLQEHIVGTTEFFESEHRIRNASDEWVWVRSRGKVVSRDAQGNPLRMAGTARDITASRRAERERRISGEVLRSMSEAVAVVDLAFRFVSVNPAFARITGYTEEEVVGQASRLLDSTQHSAEFYRRMREVLERTGHWAGEMWQRRKDGEEFLGLIEVSQVCDEQGERTHFVTVVNDITDKKRAEQELRYLANYDTLTGLPNRALLSERLARAIVRARRQDTRVAVLFLDLDRFKDINDSLGHAAGDRILKAAAARLLATVGASDTVARLGGDEFTVVLEDVEHIEAIERTARDILAAFAEPLEIDERHDVTISPSIGISLYPDHGLVPTDLLKFADTAMYQAKGVGRNTFQVYTEAMDAETRQRATMAAALRKALDRGEFRLVFQPRLSLLDGRITGVEALLRWHSAEIGEVPPASFIPLAEETGLILPIGEWVLREACLTLRRWRHNGLNDISMAVNVSVLQLLRGNLPAVLGEVLAEAGIPAERLELEVTESMVMANAEQTTAVLHALRKLGVSIAIDDFGTGYSSLVYLKRLPIDTLKIDKEFVGDLTQDPDDEAITATVITMAHSLGLNVIAEGVETQAQLDYLREHRCDEIQGYWLSPPLDAHHCLAFMRTWQPTAPTGLGVG